MEVVPSLRRPQESIVTLPLPNIRVRESVHLNPHSMAMEAGSVVTLPCDVGLLMCDPEWKIKTGVEIFVFIHRPQEDFSDLLLRWRHTQILTDRGYEWLLPQRYHHLLNDGSETRYPLFVLFPETPERILKGLNGAGLPAIVFPVDADADERLATEDDMGLEDFPDLADIDSRLLEDG
jgi:hypothetical protein